jgi:hypothetical protein
MIRQRPRQLGQARDPEAQSSGGSVVVVVDDAGSGASAPAAPWSTWSKDGDGAPTGPAASTSGAWTALLAGTGAEVSQSPGHLQLVRASGGDVGLARRVGGGLVATVRLPVVA